MTSGITKLVTIRTRHLSVFFFQAEDGIRDWSVTGVQTCALPIYRRRLRCTREGCGRRTQLLDDDPLETRLIDRLGAPQLRDGLVRRGNAEVRLDQQALHVFERDGVHRTACEEAADFFPQTHQGNPWRRRSAHSVASARVARTNSHQRSRSPIEPNRDVASPG